MNYPKCDLIDTAVSTPAAVRAIDRSELLSKLARHDDFVFVMAMDQPRFDTAHIEGSISFDQLMGDFELLARDREIVIYCTDAACAASKLRAAFLVNQGFTNVFRYAGGLADWDANGLPLVTMQSA